MLILSTQLCLMMFFVLPSKSLLFTSLSPLHLHPPCTILPVPSGHSQPVWPGLPLAVPLRWISCLPAWTLGRGLCIEPWGC